MCGISGEIIFNQRSRVVQAVLVAMRDALTHRGPDDAGAWINPAGSVGLGSRRLSIVDLSPAGHMPMSNEDGTIWITYNGEIYNHTKLRADLEKLGHQYRSHTDTETILHLYEEYGERCVEQLDGMFAFAIWDERKKQLLLARDHFGKKPLYLWRNAERLVFASEIKALLLHPSVPRRPDLTALYHYLSLSVTPAPSTMFAQIRKLAPAETLLIDAGGNETRRIYWTPFAGPSLSPVATEEEAARELLYLLRKSVGARMMSDVPVGAFLSGGIDSSANVALMSEFTNRPIETFSVAMEQDTASNEFHWARRVAKHFRCQHHEIVVTEQMFLDFTERMPFFQDEPLGDPVCVPLYYVSKLARDHGVIVTQVGEGSDEIFAGYAGYRDVVDRHRWANRWRDWAPRLITNWGANLLPGRAADFLRRLRDDEQIFWGGAVAFYETAKRSLLARSFRDQLESLSTWSVVRGFYADARREGGNTEFLQDLVYVELKIRLAELLLMRVDKMAMAASVEARVPFLDRELVEFAMRLPGAWKIHNGISKHIFRQAVTPLLPNDILQRPKQGFCGSAVNILHSRVMDKLASDLRTSSFLREVLNPKALEQLLAPHRRQQNSFKLWNLWNLALWYKCWFE